MFSRLTLCVFVAIVVIATLCPAAAHAQYPSYAYGLSSYYTSGAGLYGGHVQSYYGSPYSYGYSYGPYGGYSYSYAYGPYGGHSWSSSSSYNGGYNWSYNTYYGPPAVYYQPFYSYGYSWRW